MKLKETDIGKIAKYKGIRLIVVLATDRCRGCYFKRMTSCSPEVVGVCCKPWRQQDIIFRKYDTAKEVNQHKRLVAYGKKKSN